MRFIPLAILCALVGVTYWIGVTAYTDRIEQDIASRTNEAIEPYKPAMSLEVDGRDVTLTGSVRDEQVRAEAIETVDSVFGVRATRDSLALKDAYNIYGKYTKGSQFIIDGRTDTESAADVFEAAISPIPAVSTMQTGARTLPFSTDKIALAAGAVSMMNHGEMWIDETQLKVTGEAEDEARKALIENFLTSQQNLIDPLQLVSDITVTPLPSACLALSDTAKVTETILFDVDSAVVRDAYMGPIAELVSLVQTCAHDSDGNIIVEAHADQDGSEDYNFNLSQRRADEVTKQLLLHGLESRHIASFAFGETRPVASNETRDDKSFNRRVEVRFITGSPDSSLANRPIISTQISE